ncbi:hypothetical protein MFIFM68171_06694 [Madurella fahalii]|uniref:Uncharacterized protein n=1 Tax=Madurella fahalii TaxID=1157608 RepID=A0ABQ0GFN6_9PEZI
MRKSNFDATCPEWRIHAKQVPSQRRLLVVLKDIIGPDHNYTVEMRHNVYRIRATKDFNLDPSHLAGLRHGLAGGNSQEGEYYKPVV